MTAHKIAYEADGLQMEGELHLPKAAGPRPGVLVFPEAFGLGAHARGRAARLAEEGYVALACDLHGGGRVIEDLASVMPIIGALRGDALKIRARAGGGLAALLERPEVEASKVAAIGFCFGGTMALELARGGAAIVGAVGFHSGLGTSRPEDAHQINGKVLVCIGADDPGVPAEQRAAFETEMRAGGVDWRMNLYGGVVHSFTNPDADKMGRPEMARYDAGADARSWAEMSAFFKEVFRA